MITRPEILAPAGSMESLRAAVECGADAVYLGAGHFNARRNAQNFTEEELRDAIEYCHVRGVKVHLTLNTLVSDEELPDALDLIEASCALGVDALIVQDLGIAALVRETAPDMELHASTQMAVMTPDGFRELANLGFTRAVLPRELSLQEIRMIRESTRDTGLELEMFIHGALCMCVSGQCYLSSMMGGRSGNRGLCAQPCRLPFFSETSDHALSLRDLSAVEAIPALFEEGVLSFKIEGRMKRPEYVAAAVTACRNAADGTPDKELLARLDAVFSRSGHTNSYLEGTLGHEMFGIRRKDDVTAASPVLKQLEQLYKKERRAAPVTFSLEAKLDQPLKLTASRDSLSVTVDTSEDYRVEAARNVATTKEKVLAQLGKTGGTGFSLSEGGCSVTLDEGVNIPASVLNDLRRKALSELTKAISKSSRKSFDRQKADERFRSLQEASARRPVRSRKTAYARLSDAAQRPALQRNAPVWILPVSAPVEEFDRLSAEHQPFGVEIPRGLYGSLPAVKEQLRAARGHGASFAFAGTLDGTALAKEAGLPILGGFTLNAFNSVSLQEWQRLGVRDMTVSQELRLTQIGTLKKPPEQTSGLLVYGRAPLMLTRNAPDGIDGTHAILTDRKQVAFPVQRDGDAFALLNSRPLWMADRIHEVRGVEFHLYWFTVESPEDVETILDQYKNQMPAAGEFTRGLYYKGVL